MAEPDDPTPSRAARAATLALLALLPIGVLAYAWHQAAARRSSAAPPPIPASTAPRAPAGPRPPEEAISALSAGVRLLEQFRYADAAARFEAALRLQPDWLAPRVDLAIARLNMLDATQDTVAETEARAALAAAPGDARAGYVLAYVLAERERRFDEALPLLRQVVAAEPADPSAWYQLGRSAQEASSTATDPKVLLAEARTAFEKALQLDPRFVEANYKLGRLLLDSPDAADQARGEQVLGRHEELLAGRPAVQQNYLRRGALALAFPWHPEPGPLPTPSPVVLRAGAPLPLPQPHGGARKVGGLSPLRFRNGITLGDFDGDGRLDVFAPQRSIEQAVAVLWKGAGGGAFSDPLPIGSDGYACSSAAAGDFDRDGNLDALVTCNVGNALLFGRGGGVISEVDRADMAYPSIAGLSATAVDVDHDGDLDLHVIAPAETRDGAWTAQQWIWLGDGKGGFQQMAGALGVEAPLDSEEAAWSDMDGDNAVDLLASVAGKGLTLFRNDREGRFTQVPLPDSGRTPGGALLGPSDLRLAILDADGDGDLDIVLMHGGRLSLLMNDSHSGAPSFHATAALDLQAPAPSELAVADLDLDGHPELLLMGAAPSVGADHGGSATILHFPDPGAPSGDAVDVPVRRISADGLDARLLAPADMDGDGDIDLVAIDSGGNPVVLWNELPPGPGWIRLDLAAREGRSNPQAFGARVTLDAGSLSQFAEHREAAVPLANVVASPVFGLGPRASADGVTVLWPSGIQQGEVDLPARSPHAVEELDRQPSSCPMLYGWQGSSFGFLTDCFDTAPLGLWVAPGTHVAGEPDASYRIRHGAVVPSQGAVELAVSEFLNESLLADRIALLAADHDATQTLVVDEGVRLAGAAPASSAWLLRSPTAPTARLDGADVSRALASEDDLVAGYSRPTRWTGLAEPFALEIDVPAGAQALTLTGSLNFPNSSSLYAASQSGAGPQPPRLEVLEGTSWRELTVDCGLPAGFHKDVVVDLRPFALPGAATVRLTTNLQVSWDRAATWSEMEAMAPSAMKELPLLRAEKAKTGIPAEVKGPENRWRSFPHDLLDPRPRWRPQAGTLTPDGDVRAEIAAKDDLLAFVRPGEEITLGWSIGALPPPGQGVTRDLVLVTRGWVKDADPHTALSDSVLPLPRSGSETYP